MTLGDTTKYPGTSRKSSNGSLFTFQKKNRQLKKELKEKKKQLASKGPPAESSVKRIRKLKLELESKTQIVHSLEKQIRAQTKQKKRIEEVKRVLGKTHHFIAYGRSRHRAPNISFRTLNFFFYDHCYMFDFETFYSSEKNLHITCVSKRSPPFAT